MEEAERPHLHLLILQQQVRVLPRRQAQHPPGRAIPAVPAIKIPEFLRRALVWRGDQLVDGVGEEELRVGELQAPLEEAAQPQRPENVQGGFAAAVGAALQAEGAQQPRQTEDVVPVQVRDEDLGDSGCWLEQGEKREGNKQCG